ncbi:MAG: hypothetical protein KA210_02790 [Bacteroidia bacterium]|nr:hypothetical protein [Bacteroidia bacterium]
MKIEDLKKIIVQIEQKFEVDKWEIQGVKIWPFIRIENYMQLSYEALGEKPFPTKSYKFGIKIAKSKINQLFSKFVDFKKTSMLKSKDIAFLSDGMSFVFIKNKWYNKFYDPLETEFSSRGFSSIRLDLSHYFFVPRYSSSIFVQSDIDNIIIKNILLHKLIKPKLSCENWSDFEKFYSDKFVSENLLYIPNKDVLRIRIEKVIKLKNYYTKKLKRINPKIGFVVNYYGDDQMAFILACKELNIPSVDIQHGVQGELHLGYGNWTKIPKVGYDQIPDYFWVWSQKEKETIDKWNNLYGNHKVLIGGNLFNDMWKENSSEIVQFFDDCFGFIKLNKEKKSILLTLSPYTDSLMKETWEVVKETQFKYNWLIRVHPGMIKEIQNIENKLHKFGIINFEIVESSKLPLQTLLRNVNIHITCQSSCVIEAAEFGVKSIITSEYGKALYEDQINLNNSFFMLPKIGIIEMIKEILHRKTEEKFIIQKSKLNEKALDYLICNVLK